MTRSCAYEVPDVLDRATEVFWKQGYAATTMSELCDITGLQPGSLYAGFGNKQAIFRQVIEHYSEKILREINTRGVIRVSEEKTLDSVIKFIIELMYESGARSCLLIKTLLEKPVGSEQQLILSKLNLIEQSIGSLLEQAEEIQNINERDLSSVMCTIYGIHIYIERGYSKERTIKIAVDTLRQLLNR